MLTDRRVLIEHEIEKLRKECASLYFQITVQGKVELSSIYEASKAKLHNYLGDLKIVSEAIETQLKNPTC